MIAPARTTNTLPSCRCLELNVTCACNYGGPDTSSYGNVVYVHWVRPPRGWQTPKYRPHKNLYGAPERFESQAVPPQGRLRVWLHRKPTKRATAKAVRNWRQQ